MNRFGCLLMAASTALMIYLVDLGARATLDALTGEQPLELVAAGHSCPGGLVLEKGIVEGVTLPERLYWIHLKHDDRTQCLSFRKPGAWRRAEVGERERRR